MNDRHGTMKLVAALAAVLLVQVCAADFAPTGYVTHKLNSDSLSAGAEVSFNSAVNWIEPDGSDPTAPMPGKKYYVPFGAQMSLGSNGSEHLVFAGDELVVGGDIVPYAASGYGATITNLVFLPGGRYYCYRERVGLSYRP